MSKGDHFDRVYLDEVITVTSPADPNWIDALRRRYRTEPDETIQELWEWFDEANPSLGRRSRQAMNDLIHKTVTEAEGKPWRLNNFRHQVIEGCVPDAPLDHDDDAVPRAQLLAGLTSFARLRGHTDVPDCLAGPDHPSRRTK